MYSAQIWEEMYFVYQVYLWKMGTTNLSLNSEVDMSEMKVININWQNRSENKFG